ncbi:LodA/GoxA family CTQ-dependent oxidase [Paraburkholderia sp. RL17-347-BIC-D]|uniref:LodA/GoxA family CTQ-dependent oxidase n=1 Tax=Paraburkholderia sp. RL17-347-BIC-D TaxID=3031632 RepID=UPI0038BC77F3
MSLSDVKYCKIYPGIGVARVGDSPDEFFVGPEAPGLGPEPGTEFKDAQGRVKRQAARFRVYGFDTSGKAVQELNTLTPDVRIQWSVTLANRKASGFLFAGVRHGMALDQSPDPAQLRNKTVNDRTKLEITPTPRSIEGVNRFGQQFAFVDGAFFDAAVHLGELRTDAAGRLLVLGGRGKSGAIPGSRPITHYANNDGWHDDTSDGPVTVQVSINGNDIPVEGAAWVMVAPPKFAPYLRNVVSLYDIMAEAKGIPAPGTLSFTDHIYPHFAAFANQHWVNGMALRGHGAQKSGNFLDPDTVEKLNDNSEGNAPLRKKILQRLREPEAKSEQQANYNFMPLLSGDEGDAKVGKPDTWLSITKTTYEIFQRWALGDFDSDWPGVPPQPVALEALAVEAQPAALDRASLEFCVGGAFFPGIEITYIARYPDLYSEPFRFDATKLQPGDITRRMAVPWQADFYECQVHWWPAQRPDEVLSKQSYEQALDDFPDEMQQGKLAQVVTERIRWDRGLGVHWVNPEVELPVDARPPRPGDNDMVEKWRTLGFVTPVHTGAGETLQVEIGRSRFDGLGDREYFFYMLNIDSYPGFVSKARELAESFLARADGLLNDPTPGAVDDMYRYFPYSTGALDQRLDEIYATYQAGAAADPLPDPDSPFQTKEDMVERIRQFAPLNQLDGAWVRNIAKAGPIDEVGALLFSVWMDEVGDGNPDQNHANVYTNLLEQNGIHLPPINTRDYAFNVDMLDSAYTVPMFELAISQFTETFYPEILGMTLQLEWEVLALWPTVKLLRHFGLSSHFYELHIGIDNAANGHGAKARRAVDRFLDEGRRRGGDAEVQSLWRRIWTGYVAFATTGTLGNDLRDLLDQRRNRADSTAVKVAAIMESKKKYGSLNHGDKKLGAQFINNLFEDPGAFQTALVDAGYIVPGHPEQSSFFRLTSFDGPMYKVFTDDELQVLEEWTVWLGSGVQTAPVEMDPAKLMAACIDHFRNQQEGATTHLVTDLIGPDPGHPGQTIVQSVAAWFQEPTVTFMAALADPKNQLVVSGNASQSPFIVKVLGGRNSMSQAFDVVALNTGGKTWKQIVVQWIDGGCPIPRPTEAERLRPLAAGSPAVRLALTAPLSTVARHPRGRVQGMGVVH